MSPFSDTCSRICSAGDVSLAAYIQSSLARIENKDKDVSALGKLISTGHYFLVDRFRPRLRDGFRMLLPLVTYTFVDLSAALRHLHCHLCHSLSNFGRLGRPTSSCRPNRSRHPQVCWWCPIHCTLWLVPSLRPLARALLILSLLVVVIASTFIPRGAITLNPQLIEDQTQKGMSELIQAFDLV